MILLLLACTKADTDLPDPPPTTVELAPPALQPTSEWPSVVELDAVPTLVKWDDGDTFELPQPNGESQGARLAGYNTLESYGPVHRWGDWTGDELYALSKEAGEVAAAGRWQCRNLPGGGGYGRLLVECADLRRELLSQGLAHIFLISTEATADPDDLAAQLAAQEAGRGMWAKGVPVVVISSLHSVDERPDRNQSYHRVVYTSSGQSEMRMHEDTLTACQEVCFDDSCMTYVPYEQRYGENKAACL